MKEIIFLGRGGQGAFTSSRILAIAASLYEGQYALSFPSFGPERRGAPVYAYTKLDKVEIRDRSQSEKGDYVVVLDESLYTNALKAKLKHGGKIILNTSKNEIYNDEDIISFDGQTVAEKFLGLPITNTAMLAALVFLSKIVTEGSLKSAVDYDLKPTLAKKNKRLIEFVAEKIGSDSNE